MKPAYSLAELRAMYEAGMSIRQITAKTSLSYFTAHRLLGEAGVQFRSRGGANNATRAKIAFDLPAMYREGMSIRQIAERVGVSHATVNRRLLEAGVELRHGGPLSYHPRRKINPVPTARLIEMYEQGMSLHEIGARVGMDHTSVRTRLDRAGVARRPRGKVPAATKARSQAESEVPGGQAGGLVPDIGAGQCRSRQQNIGASACVEPWHIDACE